MRVSKFTEIKQLSRWKLIELAGNFHLLPWCGEMKQMAALALATLLRVSEPKAGSAKNPKVLLLRVETRRKSNSSARYFIIDTSVILDPELGILKLTQSVASQFLVKRWSLI